VEKGASVPLVECQVRVVHAGRFERGDDAIELGHIRHGANAHTIQRAPGNAGLTDEDVPETALAQLREQSFRVGRIGECARLDI
jgi:hypothetical protein